MDQREEKGELIGLARRKCERLLHVQYNQLLLALCGLALIPILIEHISSSSSKEEEEASTFLPVLSYLVASWPTIKRHSHFWAANFSKGANLLGFLSQSRLRLRIHDDDDHTQEPSEESANRIGQSIKALYAVCCCCC